MLLVLFLLQLFTNLFDAEFAHSPILDASLHVNLSGESVFRYILYLRENGFKFWDLAKREH